MRELLDVTRTSITVARYKPNLQNPASFLFTDDVQGEKEVMQTGPCKTASTTSRREPNNDSERPLSENLKSLKQETKEDIPEFLI